MGVDAESTYCRVVADEMGVKYDDVECRPFDEIPGFEHTAGGGSSGSAANLPSLIVTARKAKSGLLEYAVKPLSATSKALFDGKTVAELDIRDGFIFEKANAENKQSVAKLASSFWKSSGPGGPTNHPFFFQEKSVAPSTAGGRHVFARQAYWQEVEVDADTGQIDVKKVVVVNDLGLAISPDGCRGQQLGGTYMGFGRAGTEGQYYCPATGVKLNDNLLGYCVPTILEIEEIDTHILENRFGYGAYGIYGIGESAAANGAAILSVAIYNAIGKWVDFPCTPDKILKALGKA
jgi:xanthine dehydrogenase molybdenum-binding subunit